jgi:hypothetical protein
MSDIDIDELERLAKATRATSVAGPGEWRVFEDEDCLHVANDTHKLADLGDEVLAAFIAAANPATVLALIAALRQAHAERDAARAEGAAEALERVARELRGRQKKPVEFKRDDFSAYNYGIGYHDGYGESAEYCEDQAAALREGSK